MAGVFLFFAALSVFNILDEAEKLENMGTKK
jgi:hypothetical protein